MIDEVKPEETRKEVQEEQKTEGPSESQKTHQDLEQTSEKSEGQTEPERTKGSEETQQDLEEKEMNEEQKDLEYIASATRASRQGTYERFMVSSLASVTVMTDEVKRVKQICLAALFVPEERRKELAIDYERIEVLNAVANAFLNYSTRTIQGYNVEIAAVSWGFAPSEENYDKYIKPWFRCIVSYYPYLLRHTVEFERTSSRNEWPKIKHVFMDPIWVWFFDATTCLSMDGYKALSNAFTAWATKQVQLYLAELTNMIDPGLYDQFVGFHEKGRKKGYAEKVSETAEPKTEESDNVDSMGPN